MKYNSEHYLIGQVYGSQEETDYRTDQNVKEFIENFKRCFGHFEITPGSFKIISTSEKERYNDKLEVELKIPNGNLGTTKVRTDRFSLSTKFDIQGILFEDRIFIRSNDDFYNYNFTVYDYRTSFEQLYCGNIEGFNHGNELNISYYDSDTVNCLTEKYGFKFNDFINAKAADLLKLGFEPDSQFTILLNEIEGLTRNETGEALDLTKPLDFKYYLFNVATIDDIKSYIDKYSSNERTRN